MKSKSASMVRRNHARYHQGRDDLNIVPMIDMMVILVFFLIFTAVFSKTNILQLNLPANASAAPLDLPKGLKLEVIIRPERSGGERPQLRAAEGAGEHAERLRSRRPVGVHAAVKANYPQMTDATILPGPNVSYDTLVQVMDTVRVYQIAEAPFSKAELFPDIAIADAPP